MPARRATNKAVYRIRNWSLYNEALGRRGAPTLRGDPATWKAWRYQGPAQGGAQYEYGVKAIEWLLTLRAVYHLPLRATEGFARSIFGLMAGDLPVPDFSTLRRRAATVRVTQPKRAEGPIHGGLASTGRKVYGQGEWKVRRDGYTTRRTWLKLPPAADPQTHEIRAAVVSAPGVTAAEATPALLERVENPVEVVTAEGMYDRGAVYAEGRRRGAHAVIPPRGDAKIIRHGDTAGRRLDRDETLRRIRQVGRAAWKAESGYHERSLGETAVFRMKPLWGAGGSSRKDGQEATEVGVRSRASNIMAHRGMPETVRLAAWPPARREGYRSAHSQHPACNNAILR